MKPFETHPFPFLVPQTRLMNQKNLAKTNQMQINTTTTTTSPKLSTNQMESIQIYKGSIDCGIQTVRNEGFRALYKGFIPAWLRMGPWNIIFFITYEQLKQFYWNEKTQTKITKQMFRFPFVSDQEEFNNFKCWSLITNETLHLKKKKQYYLKLDSHVQNKLILLSTKWRTGHRPTETEISMAKVDDKSNTRIPPVHVHRRKYHLERHIEKLNALYISIYNIQISVKRTMSIE